MRILILQSNAEPTERSSAKLKMNRRSTKSIFRSPVILIQTTKTKPMIIPNSAIKIALFGFNHKQSPLLNQSACLAKQSARINVNILIINPVVFGIVLSLYDKWRNMKKSINSLIFFMLIFSG